MLLDLILVPFWYCFGTLLGQLWMPKSAVEASWEHLGSLGSILGAPRDNLGRILGAFWNYLAYLGASLEVWCHVGSILGAKTSPKLSMSAYLFLEICLRNFANFSFDSVLHTRPSDSWKLSCRLHEKQVFVKSLLRNFIKNWCWKRPKLVGFH